eukprot:TRINITY_DN39868_c0_g1_i1.p1 TRINITY_DN39868_c0_g1~~TRINITY_DN39868_c0_g1_i1.p1  ORF type:complete len:361 (-),score=35.32 TRINITY_DN39868_c0_g1_i1:83-1165(-)
MVAGDPHVAKGVVGCTRCAFCVSLLLLAIGATLLIASLTNLRHEKVDEYDSSVDRWTTVVRPQFSRLEFSVNARWVTSADDGQTRMMEASELERHPLHDREHGLGLLDYTPLRFASHFDFVTNYTGNRNRTWKPLPSYDDADRLLIQFSCSNPNGTTSTFALPSMPLAFDQIGTRMTPNPQSKCRTYMRGSWYKDGCHIARRLAHVCVQVEMDSVTGGWRLRKKMPEGNVSLLRDIYGCDSKSASVATYVYDSCYNNLPPKQCADTSAHRVQVVVRSSEDPFLRADMLTAGTLDFGPSPGPQWQLGMFLVFFGSCICVFPLGRYCATRCGYQPEDQRSLKHSHREQGIYDGDIMYGNPSC